MSEAFLREYFPTHQSPKRRGSQDVDKWIASLKAIGIEDLDAFAEELRGYQKREAVTA